MKKNKYNLHFRRIEFKYIVPSEIIDAIIPTIVRYMYLDPYVQDKNYYLVNSLYFDSKDFITFYQKMAGIRFRKKYRIRYYDDPKKIFFEIKRKIGDTVIKDRVFKQNNYDLEKLSTTDLKKNTLSLVSDPYFHSELTHDYHILKLEPKLSISYKRSPYISKYDKNLRITFDYDIKAKRFFDVKHRYINNGFYTIGDRYTILEIKFNASIPAWLGYIIKSQNLNRLAISKYTTAVEKIYGLC